MSAEEISLLGHLHTPILVGDPDGCIVYANPTFRQRFCRPEEDPVGQPLAMVFGGGAREVVLGATAQVLQRGQAARLQLREGGQGYTGLCSPIEAEDDRVGVVMVMLEEQSAAEHLTILVDEVGEPLVEALQSMQRLGEQLRGSRFESERAHLEQGVHAIETAQKWLGELSVALRGGKAQIGRFDVASSIMRVSERVGQDRGGNLDLEVLMPPNLPRVAGSSAVFERALAQLMRQRIDESKPGAPMTLLARTLGGDAPKGVLVTLVDVPDGSRRLATGLPPEAVQQSLAQMGGDALCVEDSTIGRATSMQLAIATG